MNRSLGSLGLVAIALAAGCAPPVRVVRQSPQQVHREITQNALTSGRMSEATHIVVRRLDLGPYLEQHPTDALVWLARVAASPAGTHDDLFALAELSFLEGERAREQAPYRGSAVAAWAFLFPLDPARRPNRFDPRLRIAADLYNRALTMGFQSPDGGHVDVRDGTFSLPWGSLVVSFDESELEWSDRRLGDFVPVAEFGIEGLENRYRRPGIGAPLAASTTLPPEALPGTERLIAKRVKVPVTAVLRIDATTLASPEPQARFEIHAASDSDTIDVEGERVPLEIEPTSALAYMLTESNPWARELSAFLLGDLLQQEHVARMVALEPHRPGRIPVVLVHGTASSAARWADMLNELQNDPRIRSRFEFWFFTYDTGNPIPYSALLLRDAIRDSIKLVDPSGADPCLRDAVVIGHSQGGLLTKMTAVDTGDLLWRNVSRKPLDELDLEPEDRELVRRSLFIEPMPEVQRVVYISTPHRGSYLAGAGIVRNLVARLVTMPQGFVRLGTDLFGRNRSALAQADIERIPTAVDNMSPDNPFVKTLASISTAPGVAANSIVAVSGTEPLEQDGDGVVKYVSAHREDVESELVVLSGHSAQSNPHAIGEVRRILLLHAAEATRTGACPTGQASP